MENKGIKTKSTETKNKIIVPPMLREFLVEWLEWATSEDPRNGKFRTYVGLCGCLSAWYYRSARNAIGYSPIEALKVAFRESDLDPSYPFGRENFMSGVKYDTQHLDPARLAWVRKVIADNQEGSK